MQITGIIPLDKRRNKIYIDEAFAFVLYKGECSHYGLCEDSRIDEKTYADITELLGRRAMNRSLYLLKSRDYTEGWLRSRLGESGYPENVISAAIDRLKEYGYVNDYSYAESFIRNNAANMSRKELEYKLIQRRVPQDILKEVLSEYADENGNEESEALLRLYRKKYGETGFLNDSDRQKAMTYFLRKGFSYELIISCFRQIEKLNKNEW